MFNQLISLNKPRVAFFGVSCLTSKPSTSAKFENQITYFNAYIG